MQRRQRHVDQHVGRVKRDAALISLTLQISNLDHLHKVLNKLRTLRDVKNVYRVTKREVRASG